MWHTCTTDCTKLYLTRFVTISHVMPQVLPYIIHVPHLLHMRCIRILNVMPHFVPLHHTTHVSNWTLKCSTCSVNSNSENAADESCYNVKSSLLYHSPHVFTTFQRLCTISYQSWILTTSGRWYLRWPLMEDLLEDGMVFAFPADIICIIWWQDTWDDPQSKTLLKKARHIAEGSLKRRYVGWPTV